MAPSGVVGFRNEDCELAGGSPASLHCGNNSGEIAPDAKGILSGGTMLGIGETMTAELEVIVDPAVVAEEPLCVTCGFEALHPPFSSSGGLVRHPRLGC